MNIQNLPDMPGCYMFKDTGDNVIYVGKAKDLKKRVRSYLKPSDKKTKAMMSKAHSVDFIVTDNETEAFIMENNLIKKFQPKYNIVLKDSKRYAYLLVTSEEFPRILTVRKTGNKGKYFGPFVSGQTREDLKELLIKSFKIRTCKRLPKKECLRYHIDLCDAPCTKKISRQEYLEKIDDVILALKGKNKELISKLNAKMRSLSKDQKFEKALDVREQISALRWIDEKQKVERNKRYDEDIINFIVDDDKVYLLLFNSKKGSLENKQSFVFDFKKDFLEEFLMQYYDENKIPKEIILPTKVDTGMIRYLEKKAKQKVILTVPKAGDKIKLLKIVKKNVSLMFFSQKDSLKDLSNKLKLSGLPDIIECFDISHLSGTSTVGSMVRFFSGVKDKNNYRRFKIRSVEGIDDVSAIKEVVYRRYHRLKSEKKPMPDLIVIDGGRGQLNAAYKALDTLNLKIPLISIAKKEEKVFVIGMPAPLNFPKDSPALKLLQRIRDEAHRFAIIYNRLLRKKKIRG